MVGGVTLGTGIVTVILSQAGDLAHGIVELAMSNMVGWYGIKTDWTISPSNSGLAKSTLGNVGEGPWLLRLPG